MVIDNTKTTDKAVVIFIFMFLNFLLAFGSDIILNYISYNYGVVESLKPYFKNRSVLGAAFAAGLTIVSALLINMVASYFILGFITPEDEEELIYFCILAFIIGYIIDIYIYEQKVFGNSLDLFYQEAGAGFWGALAFLFTIVISYFTMKFFLKKLKFKTKKK